MLGLEHSGLTQMFASCPEAFQQYLCILLVYQERSLDCRGKVWLYATEEKD